MSSDKKRLTSLIAACMILPLIALVYFSKVPANNDIRPMSFVVYSALTSLVLFLVAVFWAGDAWERGKKWLAVIFIGIGLMPYPLLMLVLRVLFSLRGLRFSP